MTRRILRALLILVVAGVLGWWLLPTGGPTTTLADGSTLSLESVQVGTNVSFYFGNGIQRFITKCREQVRARLSKPVGGYPTPGWTNAAFTLRYEPGPETPVGTSILWRLRDDDGVEADPRFAVRSDQQADGTVRWFLHSGRLPAQSRDLTLMIYRSRTNESAFVGQLKLANPLHDRWRGLLPQPIPASVRSGDLAVTLRQAVIDPSRKWIDLDGRKSVDPQASFRFALTGGDSGSEHWEFHDLHCSPAGFVQPLPWKNRRAHLTRSEWEVTGEWLLWPGRQDLRLMSTWVRTAPSVPERVLVLSNLVVATWSRRQSSMGVWGVYSQVLVTNHPLGSIRVARVPISRRLNESQWVLEVASDDPRFQSGEGDERPAYFLQSARSGNGDELERLDSTRVLVGNDTSVVHLTIAFTVARRMDFVIQPAVQPRKPPTHD